MSLPARLAIFALFVSAIFVSAPAEDSRAATSARIHFLFCVLSPNYPGADAIPSTNRGGLGLPQIPLLQGAPLVTIECAHL